MNNNNAKTGGTNCLMNTKQVSELTGLSTTQIRRMARSGEIKAERIGTEWLIRMSVAKSIKRRRKLHNEQE